MSNLTQRMLTAVIAGTLFVGGVLGSEYTALGLCALVAAACYIEQLGLRSPRWALQMGTVGLALALFAALHTWAHSPFEATDSRLKNPYILSLILAAALLVAALALALWRRPPFALHAVFGGLLCMGAFFIWAQLLVVAHREARLLPALAPLLMVWMSDTAGYFVGRSIGRHPLWPSVSPKKSWEGLAGSIAGCMGLAGLLHYYKALPLSLPLALLLGAALALATTAGDLLQSAQKRRAGVKDSGHLLPGHGGVYDRFDGFLLALPVYVLLLEVMK